MIAIEKETLKAPVYQPLELDFKLYLVTDRKQTGGRPLLDVVTEALKGGVRAVQLREKDLGTRELLDLAYKLRALTLRYDARLFINDRIDIAIAVDADGVHLSQNSLPPFAARRLSSRLIIGVSAHNLDEALEAERAGADFITLGPIYPTPSKLKYGPPIGIETLKDVVRHVRISVIGIGGIRFENMAEVMDAGAAGIAVVSAVLTARNVRSTTGKMCRTLG